MKARFPAVAALIVMLAVAALGSVAMAAQETISYEHESEAAFRQQLASRQIRSAIINKRLRSLRLTLKDGRHVKARYPAHTEPKVARELRHAHVKVSVLSKAQAESEAKKAPRHHKIRYIVGGVVVALAVIAGAVFLIRRRRLED
jgi:nitrate reductase gamma subunit